MVSRIALLALLGLGITACSQIDRTAGLPGRIDDAGAKTTQSARFKTLFAFDDVRSGASPSGALIAIDGTLYGVTAAGGKRSKGTVFKITTTGDETVLHSFDTDGQSPIGSLLAVDGILYGATESGGKNNDGAIFALRTDGTELWTYDFKGGWDGSDPQGGLTELKGVLYGTTYGGGNHYDNAGAFFKITRSGKETELRAFTGGTDGGNPNGNLALYKDAFYGTTFSGGLLNGSDGVVYRLTTVGGESLLHQFANTHDAEKPAAGLVNVNGVLYGTTPSGGKHSEGTVFSITADGKERVIHNFGAGKDGASPACVLVAYNGNLYGTTPYGGANQQGTIFEISPSGNEHVLYSFTGVGDGGQPRTGLVPLDGVLYGTTPGTSSHYPYGTVFSFSLK